MLLGECLSQYFPTDLATLFRPKEIGAPINYNLTPRNCEYHGELCRPYASRRRLTSVGLPSSQSPEPDRKQGTPAATVPASSRRRRRSEQLRRRSIARRRRSSSSSESEESAEAIAAAVIAAAAPVHRRVPSDVLMRWQNVPRRDPGSCEELDRPRLGSGGSGSRPPGTPPPPGRVKMLSHEFTLLSAVSSSVLVRSSTATSVSSAASKADAFIASEKHQS